MNALGIPAAIAAAGLAFGAAFAVPAAAADQSAAPRLAQAGAYSDEKLHSFALAAMDVELIRQQVTQELAQVEDAQARQDLVERATEQMLEAVETAPGINAEEYNEIVTAAEQDPALAQRIAQYMQPMQ